MHCQMHCQAERRQRGSRPFIQRISQNSSLSQVLRKTHKCAGACELIKPHVQAPSAASGAQAEQPVERPSPALLPAQQQRSGSPLPAAPPAGPLAEQHAAAAPQLRSPLPGLRQTQRPLRIQARQTGRWLPAGAPGSARASGLHPQGLTETLQKGSNQLARLAWRHREGHTARRRVRTKCIPTSTPPARAPSRPPEPSVLPQAHLPPVLPAAHHNAPDFANSTRPCPAARAALRRSSSAAHSLARASR